MFRRSWALYEKLVLNNDMRHREMGDCLHAVVTQRIARPYSLLDLGCGDAWSTSRALTGTPLQRYVGVDLVEASLELARRNLQGIASEVDLLVGDLATVWPTLDGQSFDLILASYSLHHLETPEDKTGVLFQSRKRLGPDGLLILIDIMTRNHEDRRAYLERFHEQVRMSFSDLTDAERMEIRDHMEACDWPESHDGLQDLACRAGFTAPELLYRDESELYGCLIFRPAMTPITAEDELRPN